MRERLLQQASGRWAAKPVFFVRSICRSRRRRACSTSNFAAGATLRPSPILGDQFLALQRAVPSPPTTAVVVDDDAVRNALATRASTVWSIFDFLDLDNSE